MTKKKVAILGTLGATILVLIALALVFTAKVSITGEPSAVLVDDDDNIDSVKVKLSQMSGGMTVWAFGILADASGYSSHIRTGRYEVNADTRLLPFFRKIRNGSQDPVKLTIRSVRTVPQLAAFLGDKLMLDSAAIASAMTDSTFCASMGYDAQTIISLFVPNTYEVYWDVSLERFFERMKKENAAFWTADRTRKAADAGLDKVEVFTLASIIDEETANNAEKPMVAGMYINRLHKGMPLQADPTVKFALQDFALRRIYHEHLNVQSPYNTYRNVGLPPGPIRIPSVAGIDAVLGYVHHDYLFMCAKEDFSGTHNFARTYAEHLQNAARYSKALNERGIK